MTSLHMESVGGMWIITYLTDIIILISTYTQLGVPTKTESSYGVYITGLDSENPTTRVTSK